MVILYVQVSMHSQSSSKCVSKSIDLTRIELILEILIQKKL